MLAVFAALSAAPAPVSWVHAYCPAALLAVLGWTRALRLRPVPWPELALLFLFTAEAGGFAVAARLLSGVSLALSVLAAPLLTAAYAVYVAWRQDAGKEKQQLHWRNAV